MQRGSVVLSLAGHDKDKLYVVLRKEGSYAFLSDGRTKTLKDPKKKNLKHLKDTGMYIDISKYNPLYDAHIQKELKGLLK